MFRKASLAYHGGDLLCRVRFGDAPSGTLTSGFVLVVNDVAVPAGGREVDKVHDGDEIAIIPALAGG